MRKTKIHKGTVAVLAAAALLLAPHPLRAAAADPSAAADLQCSLWHVDDGSPEGHSQHLGCTGLYANFATRTISPAIEAFEPGYVLWSDGAKKTRWIYLPPGTRIDTTDMDGWVFPVGTKVWKQFVLGGRLVETRMLWKRASGWFGAVYVWLPGGTAALEYTGATGLPVLGDGLGEPYEVPSNGTCAQCHGGSKDRLLGFAAVNLAAERAQGLTLSELTGRGLLSAPPSSPPVVPGDGPARDSLGWLHANCGSCHGRGGQAAGTGLQMRLETAALATVEATATWQSAVGLVSSYQPPAGAADCGAQGTACLRIDPGHPEASTVVFRASARDAYPGPYPNQMPPLPSHRVPTEAVTLLAGWIAGLPPR